MDSQAVDNGASLSTLPLPVVDLSQEAKKGFLGVGHVSVWGPAQELEVPHHKLAFLELQSFGEIGALSEIFFSFFLLSLNLKHHICVKPYWICFTHIPHWLKHLCGYQPEGILPTHQTCSSSDCGAPRSQLLIGCWSCAAVCCWKQGWWERSNTVALRSWGELHSWIIIHHYGRPRCFHMLSGQLWRQILQTVNLPFSCQIHKPVSLGHSLHAYPLCPHDIWTLLGST